MSNREQIPDIINSHKLLKDLGKEVRHSERFINSLNPPKPERESKRKRKKPINKDFVDFSMPQKSYELFEPTIKAAAKTAAKPATKPATKPAAKQAAKPAAKQTGKQNKPIAKQNTKQVVKPKVICLSPIPFDFGQIPDPPQHISPSPSIPISTNKIARLPSYSYNTLMPPPTPTNSQGVPSLPDNALCSTLSGTLAERSWSEYAVDPNERWVVTNVTANGSDRPGAILKFTLGSKEAQAEAESEGTTVSVSECFNYEFTASKTTPQSIFDFNEDPDHREDDFALKIDESPKKRRAAQSKIKTIVATQPKIEPPSFLLPPEIELDLNSDVPKNGIETLLKASVLTNKLIDSGRASPSTREAIAGMLSIGQTYSMPVSSFATSNSKTARKRKIASPPKDHFEENIRNVHQDDEYIYPSLDNSDEEDCHIFKPRGRSKVDEAWNPKARVGPLLPKMNRPAREGTKKQAVEKVLEAAAAKRASEPIIQEPQQKRTYKKKKIKPMKQPSISSKEPSYSSVVSSSSSQSLSSTAISKQKKGMKTAKQRLGKILKIHKMIH